MKKKYALGIGLNLFNARAIVLREDGKVVAEVKEERTNLNANETIKVLLKLFENILAKAKSYSIKTAGLALGGIVNKKTGTVYWPQGDNYYVAVPLKAHLQKRFSLPVLLENDANACAWAEYDQGFNKKYKDMIYMFSGVGCGIIADGCLYEGSTGCAGELFLNSQRIMNSCLGDFSIFKQWSADLNMLKRVKESVLSGKRSSLAKKAQTAKLSLEDVFAAAKQNDKIAQEAVKEAAFSLGIKVAFLINLLNPSAVVIGGGMERAGEPFLEGCLEAVKAFAFNEISNSCQVFLARLGLNATSLGAAMLAFK